MTQFLHGQDARDNLAKSASDRMRKEALTHPKAEQSFDRQVGATFDRIFLGLCAGGFVALACLAAWKIAHR